ncbi:hypothetical protein EXIGLDRAFT_635180 [Exidia glandulosa HHB12029]|uniref:NADH dehydrogenase [ubiquinone] 1 alpha subcomplex subunit 13 n=1 Tax=Exidia glandulosa HHB12029 TaxID=1314781 RepID=A0A165QN73_EXIGL|nr:hypothetical protein EXIGLDRAFT_635180 [Exidia glandulosa HHB12029]
MPPAGGFETLRYKRNLPTRGPSAYAILAGVTASVLYGCYVVAKARIEQKELEREKAWSRIYLTPLLMAEADRDTYRRQQIANAREAAIMSKVPGWSVRSVQLLRRPTC